MNANPFVAVLTKLSLLVVKFFVFNKSSNESWLLDNCDAEDKAPLGFTVSLDFLNHFKNTGRPVDDFDFATFC